MKEYAWLVEEVRKNQKKMLLDAAVDKAIREMPKDSEILLFLESHKAEVKGMLLTEYDEAKAMELFRQDGIREGRKEGLKAGAEILKKTLQKLGMSEEEIDRIVAENYPSNEPLTVNEDIERYELPGV